MRLPVLRKAADWAAFDTARRIKQLAYCGTPSTEKVWNFAYFSPI
jgi:hypothetical protein